MNRFFRPTVLGLVVALTLGAAGLMLWPLVQNTTAARAMPRPVPGGDQEIAWLNNATSGVAWERFVAAVRRLAAEQADLGLEITADANAFPSETTAIPEFAVRIKSTKARLWFRWYKLTGDLGTGEWVQALGKRNPPPLAVIGGSSSDRARDLAGELKELQARLPSSPLLLITTATADQVDLEEGGRDLMTVYAGRSFRFCFTNRQMAEAVTDFIWRQDDLRPDEEPIYLTYWEDDPYSKDLFDRFHDEVLGPDRFGGLLRRNRLAQTAARDWGWVTGHLAGGMFPPTDLESFGRSPAPFCWQPILYSVGSFNHPNRWEAEVADYLMDNRGQHLTQQRPLLVLPGSPQPARRFLRALIRTSPSQASRFVVATGDAIDFDTVYRDRNLKWPIQDLPFALVLFCHRNPVDASAFQPDQSQADSPPPDPGGRTSTGTQDLLLYQDIVETTVKAAYDGPRLMESPDDVLKNLREARLKDGQNRFDPEGNPPSGNGECVVCLRPQRSGDRVLPRSVLQVWNRSVNPDGQHWLPVKVAGLDELVVDYTAGTAADLQGVEP